MPFSRCVLFSPGRRVIRQRGAALAVGDHAGIAHRAEVGLARVPSIEALGNVRAHSVADADALPVGKADAAVLPPARAPRVREREDGDERRVSAPSGWSLARARARSPAR